MATAVALGMYRQKPYAIAVQSCKVDHCPLLPLHLSKVGQDLRLGTLQSIKQETSTRSHSNYDFSMQVPSACDIPASHIIKIIFAYGFGISSPWPRPFLSVGDLPAPYAPMCAEVGKLWRGSEELKSISHLHHHHLIVQQTLSHIVLGSPLGTRGKKNITIGLIRELNPNNWRLPTSSSVFRICSASLSCAGSCPRIQS